MKRSKFALGEVGVDIVEAGTGRPIVFLHGDEGVEADLALLERLARAGRVIAPSHPGFGRSDLPAAFRSVDDLAYFYLDLFDRLHLRDAVLIGVSFGGWIAAEIAIRSSVHFSHLVLGSALGIRVARDETAADIRDIFTLPQDEIDRGLYAEPQRWRPALDPADEEAFLVAARNRESLCLYGWSPYMHNPVLKRWLRRIGVPTLVLWGARDGIASPDYGRAFAASIPGARFDLIEGAAHRCYVERADAFAEAVLSFALRPAPAALPIAS